MSLLRYTGRESGRGNKGAGRSPTPYKSIVVYFILALLFVAGGCGPKRAVEEDVLVAPEGKTVISELAIEGIGVEDSGDTILIEASDRFKYTAFRLTDPPRLIIDIPGVSMDLLAGSMDIGNRYIARITTSTYGEGRRKIGRVEIVLNEGIDYELSLEKNTLKVALSGLGIEEVMDLHMEDDAVQGDIPFELTGHGAPVPGDVAPSDMEYAGDGFAVEDGGPGTDEDGGAKYDGEESGGDSIHEKSTEDRFVVEEVEGNGEEDPVVEEDADIMAVKEVLASSSGSEGSIEATKLLGIETYRGDGAPLVKIVTDGSVGSYDSFTLANPSRLVIDIWGVVSSMGKGAIGAGYDNLDRIRVGRHPDKTRVVIDSALARESGYSIDKMDDGLLVRLDTAAHVVRSVSLKEAEPRIDIEESAVEGTGQSADGSGGVGEEAAPAEGEEDGVREVVSTAAGTAAKGRPIIIEDIIFKKVDGKARVAITTSGKAAYNISEALDGRAMAIDLWDSIIPKELEKTLDTTALHTPVISVSSFQASGGADNVVRVLVKLDQRTPYEVKQDGNLIWVDLSIEKRDAAVKKAVVHKAETEAEGIEGEKATMPKKKYTGRKISLDLKDADITNVLRLIAEVSNLNIISGDDVKGTISLRLVEVPWDQAFDIILRTKGLGKVHEGNVMRVAPLARIKQEQEARLASMKAKEKLEPLKLKLIPVSYATAQELSPKVKSVLSDRGTVSVDSRTNMLIINDIKANLDEAVKLVKKLDTPTPQVLIETRIIEAQSIFARDLGIQWGAAGGSIGQDAFGSGFGSTATSPPSTATPSGFIGTGGQFSEQPNFAVNLPAAGTAGALGALGFSFGKLTGDPLLLDLRISAGEQKGLTKTISRPRVTTLDNKEAKIAQGDSIPFETTSASGTRTQFIDATLQLVVTPHITPDGSVLMKIKASRNSIGSFRSSTGTPSISKKEAETEIIVKSGETAVIGGIVVSDEADSTSGIPFFKDIPILGWLFKAKSLADSQTELLIFITPTILSSKGGG